MPEILIHAPPPLIFPSFERLSQLWTSQGKTEREWEYKNKDISSQN